MIFECVDPDFYPRSEFILPNRPGGRFVGSASQYTLFRHTGSAPLPGLEHCPGLSEWRDLKSRACPSWSERFVPVVKPAATVRC